MVKELGGERVLPPSSWREKCPRTSKTCSRKSACLLFPEKLGDLTTACSCPDWSNPCKHIAAVYYLLGEEFDRDPFLIFKLRGLSREELLEQLSSIREKPSTRKTTKKAAPTAMEKKEQPVEPLPPDSAAFWAAGSLADDMLGEVQTPPVSAALPKRLGSFPFWRGQDGFWMPLSRFTGKHRSGDWTCSWVSDRTIHDLEGIPLRRRFRTLLL